MRKSILIVTVLTVVTVGGLGFFLDEVGFFNSSDDSVEADPILLGLAKLSNKRMLQAQHESDQAFNRLSLARNQEGVATSSGNVAKQKELSEQIRLLEVAVSSANDELLQRKADLKKAIEAVEWKMNAGRCGPGGRARTLQSQVPQPPTLGAENQIASSSSTRSCGS